MQNTFRGMHKTHAIFMHSPCTPLDGAVMHSSRGVQNTWRYATWILPYSFHQKIQYNIFHVKKTVFISLYFSQHRNFYQLFTLRHFFLHILSRTFRNYEQ